MGEGRGKGAPVTVSSRKREQEPPGSPHKKDQESAADEEARKKEREKWSHSTRAKKTDGGRGESSPRKE